MAEHRFTKKDVVKRLSGIKGKKLEEIDNKGIFDHHEEDGLQKGIAGTIIERCVFDFPKSDSKQEADLLIDDVKTELKTTGLINSNSGIVPKENVSVTAVSVYKSGEETFETSHFLEKVEHLLFVYYEFLGKRRRVKPIDYKPFPILDYQFYDISNEEKELLKKDWENVHLLIRDIWDKNPGEHDKKWEEKVKEQYISRRKEIRERGLHYVDLAPKWPPRFRLKSGYVSYIYNQSKHKFEKIDDSIKDMTDFNNQCEKISDKYFGMTVRDLAKLFDYELPKSAPKNIGEILVSRMFGAKKKKLRNIDFFAKEGIIPKILVFNKNGIPKEDTKFFRVDFDELIQSKFEYYDDNDCLCERDFEFEDSYFYKYFTENKFMMIMFKKGKTKNAYDDIFIGLEELYFGEDIINKELKKLWEDSRKKITNKKLKDIPTIKSGKQVILSNGEKSTHPNFFTSVDNSFFIKLSGRNSWSINKTECVNGIKMVPQYVWIRKKTIRELLDYNMSEGTYDRFYKIFEKNKK